MGVLEATGAQLWGALERALSRCPAYCDIFPHCSSGFQIWFDPSKPPGRRIGDVRLKGALLQPRELYRVCVTPRLAYHCFLGSDAPRGPADVVMYAAGGPPSFGCTGYAPSPPRRGRGVGAGRLESADA